MSDNLELPTKYLNEKQVSELTGLGLSTLKNHRFEKRGIPFVKAGRSVRYNSKDVLEFMESNKVIPIHE